MKTEESFGVESERNMTWHMGMGQIQGIDRTINIDEYSKRSPANGVELE